MKLISINNRRYGVFEKLSAQAGLIHGFSTQSEDMALNAPEGAKCREQMVVDLGFDPSALRCAVQIHETNIAVVNESVPAGRIADVDGLITNLAETPMMTFSADCPLVLAFDPVTHALGMVHASWRCTVGRACTLLVEAMVRELGAQPRDLLVGIGPGAGVCCYEVGEDVKAAASKTLTDADGLFETRDGHLYFDLCRANQAQLVEVGVREDNIELSGMCTLCHSELFYSYRKDKTPKRFALVAGLRRS